jgi:hypothetical protein
LRNARRASHTTDSQTMMMKNYLVFLFLIWSPAALFVIELEEQRP